MRFIIDNFIYVDYTYRKFKNNCKVIIFTERVSILKDLFELDDNDKLQSKIVKDIPQSKHMGSTALILQLEKGKNDMYNIQVMNVGDCRAVLCNEYNIAINLTKDHKPMMWEEKMRIEKLGGKITKDAGDDPRINGLAVSRAFGDLDVLPYVTHVPEICNYQVNINSHFVILGCDGVWDVVSSQEAVDFVLREMLTTEANVLLQNYHTHTQKNIAKKLGEYAIKKGSGDNISVVILFFTVYTVCRI